LIETLALSDTMPTMIRAYIIMGAAGSGRREVISDLLSSAQEAGIDLPAALVLHENEKSSDADRLFDGKATLLRWKLDESGVLLPEFPEGIQTAFVVLDGRADPVDQMEKLSEFLRKDRDVELARIITIVNCKLLSENPQLKLWFDACVRFSDVVLLNRREGVPNKWVGDFTNRFVKKEFYPCLFGFVKAGKVDNPAGVMFPEARRMSLAFDVFDDMTVAEHEDDDLPDYEIVDETGDDEAVVEDDDESDDAMDPEPFFERDIAGRRKIRLPDISEYL
jgi:hypothetical protein